MSQVMFMHSRCCMSHWKLEVRDKKYRLECADCGRDSGIDFKNDPFAEKIEKCCNGIIEFVLEDKTFKAICEKCEKDLGLIADVEVPDYVGCECCTGGQSIH